MMTQEMKETIREIRDFLEGQGNPWAWDDFLSVPPPDPEVAELQIFCRELSFYYPPEKETEYCSKAGMDQLRARIDQLSSQED